MQLLLSEYIGVFYRFKNFKPKIIFQILRCYSSKNTLAYFLRLNNPGRKIINWFYHSYSSHKIVAYFLNLNIPKKNTHRILRIYSFHSLLTYFISWKPVAERKILNTQFYKQILLYPDARQCCFELQGELFVERQEFCLWSWSGVRIPVKPALEFLNASCGMSTRSVLNTKGKDVLHP